MRQRLEQSLAGSPECRSMRLSLRWSPLISKTLHLGNHVCSPLQINVKVQALAVGFDRLGKRVFVAGLTDWAVAQLRVSSTRRQRGARTVIRKRHTHGWHPSNAPIVR